MINSLSWNTLTVVIQVVVQLIYTALIARMIAPQSFALMGIVLSIIGFAEIFSQVGIGPALIQRKEIDQAHISGAFWTSVILGLAFTLGFVASAPAIAKAYGIAELKPIIQVVCTSFTISALAVVPRSLMMKEMKFKNFFFASMVSIIGGNLVVGLTLAYLQYDVWAYVWALFAQNALMTLAFWYYHPISVSGGWKWSAIKELFRYGTGSTLFNSLNYAATKMDVSLVPLFMKRSIGMPQTEQLRLSGMYERSAYVISLPITIIAKLSDSVLFSGMAKMQDDKEQLKRTVLVGTHVMAVLIIPATAWVIVFAPELIHLYLGPRYQEAVPILQVLFSAVIFRTLSRLADALLRASDAVFIGSWVKGIYLVLMAVGIFLSIPYGLTAIAWSISITTLIHYLMGLYLCRKLIQIKLTEQIQALSNGSLLGLTLGGISWLAAALLRQCSFPPILILLLGLGLFLFAFGFIAFLRPQVLGKKGESLLLVLPARIKNHRFIQRMIQKL